MNAVKLGLTFFILLVMPSFIYVFGNASSMALGTILSIFLFFIIIPPKNFVLKVKTSLVIPIILILVTQILYILVGGYNEKALFSVFTIIFIFVSAHLIANQILFYKNIDYSKALMPFLYIMLFLGVSQVFFKFPLWGYQYLPKSIFPFSEPSHYAINLSALLIFSTNYFNRLQLLLFVALILFMGASYPNVTLISLVVIIFFLNINSGYGVLVIFTLALIIYFQLDRINLSYFLDRLIMNESNTNITSLVFLQGWEDAYNGFFANSGFGLGFQNMGQGELGYYGQLIESILGESKNRNDGGFLAAKILGEFGFVGLLFILYYLYLFWRSFKALLYFKNNSNKTRDGLITFMHSIVIGFFVELFFRGYGYFTPGVLLFIVSIMVLQNQKSFYETSHASS